MRKKIILVFFTSVIINGCDKRPGIATPQGHAPHVIQAKENVIPSAPPEVVPLLGVKSVIAKKPRVVKLPQNIFPAVPDQTKEAGDPKTFIPGENGLKLPVVVPAIHEPHTAGTPEIILAKDPYVQDNNPESISIFNTLHGLKSNLISSLMQDQKGNLWIGTWEGNGVTKYDGQTFTNYSTEQGLTSDWINCIFEDRAGNIWMGTVKDGINKFDGKTITHYSKDQGLSDNFVWNIIQDRQGDIWIATNNGLNKYNGSTFTHYGTEQGFPHNIFRGLLEDSKGNIWIGVNGGLICYDGKTFQDYSDALHIPENVHEVISIIEDKNGNIWFGSNTVGLFKYDGQYVNQYTTNGGLSLNNISKIIVDKKGNLWITTWGGPLNKYDGKSFTHLGADQGLTGIIISVLEDRNGIIWLGTNRGITRYDGEIFKHFRTAQGLIKDQVSCVTPDRNGNLWIGIWGGGVNKYDGTSISSLTPAHGLTDTGIHFILEDRAGNIWISHDKGVDKFDGSSITNYSVESGLINNGVYHMCQDKKGNLWFATQKGASKFDGNSFTQYAFAQGLTTDIIYHVYEDQNGNIWFGTAEKGAYKYDGSRFIHYGEKQGLTGINVYSIKEDNNSNIWLGTNEGVNKFDGKFFTHYTTEQGLNGGVVKDILKDKNNNLWFGTVYGLNLLRKDYEMKTGSLKNESFSFFKKYSQDDGFFGKGIYEHSLSEDYQGNIWIGATDRLTKYHPQEDIPDTVPPNIQLTNVSLFGDPIDWLRLKGDPDTSILLRNRSDISYSNFRDLSNWYGQPEGLELAYNNNYINFHFVGITTKRPKEIKYRYFLQGLDDNWSAFTNQPEATYNNLPEGSYIFKVKAVNSEGYWSKELAYAFVIHPPWWRAWWFRIGTIIIAVVLFYAIIKWRLKEKYRIQLDRSEKEKQLATLRHKSVQLEMQALRAQMNPHFIFNSLNSINRFILQNNKSQASEYLTKFSRLVRLILQNSQASMISLESELESLKLYIELEAVRFDHQFEYKIVVDKELDISGLKVPPLIIQPYVENAIWHGLMHKEEKGHLMIEITEKDDLLVCKIIDNGVGRKKAADLKSKSASNHKSMGMRITADRIAILQQEKQIGDSISIIDLTLPDGGPGGTEVLIKIPIQYD
jgi:ligand-binding sensor domain-containing protein